MRNMKVLVSMACMLWIVPPDILRAQQETAPSTRSIQWFGIGGGLPASDFYTLSVGVNYGRGRKGHRRFHQIGLYRVEASVWQGRPASINSLSYAMGIGSLGRAHRIVGFLGPSFVWGSKPGDNNGWEGPAYFSGGVFVNAQAVFMPLRNVGFGMEGFANVNFLKPVAGLNVMLTIGGVPR